MMSKTHFGFTICSNNYLGQTLALKNSFLKHNPSFGFYIFLVDLVSDKIDYKLFEPAVIIPVAELDTIDLEDLIAKYYIIELNTSIKPSAFKYLIKNNPKASVIYYLDPDLYFYHSLEKTNKILETNTAVLTPHILSPIPRDGKLPDENTFMRFGIYNLGFLGLNTFNTETLQLLDWWEERTLKFGYDRPTKGYFVDQLWMVYAPLFYRNVVILDTFNYNMAPWNLHERYVVEKDGEKIILNDNTQLVFYHFSKIAENEIDISREYNRYVLDDFPILKELYISYKKELELSKHFEYKNISIAYPVRLSLKDENGTKSSLHRVFKKGSRILNSIANRF